MNLHCFKNYIKNIYSYAGSLRNYNQITKTKKGSKQRIEPLKKKVRAINRLDKISQKQYNNNTNNNNNLSNS